MAFDGNGTFVRIYNWATDKANGIKIRADRMDAETDGIATGLSTCITKDGQTTVTANLPMATFKHTGVGAASTRTDYGRASQLQDNDLTYFTTGGTINAYTLTPSPAITALAAGQEWLIKIHAACAAAPTLAVSGLTAATIVYADGTAIAASELALNGQYLVRYDGTNYRLANMASTGITSTYSTGLTGTIAWGSNLSNVQCAYPSTTGMDMLVPSTTQGKLVLLVKQGPYELRLYGTINGAVGTISINDRQSLPLTYTTIDGAV